LRYSIPIVAITAAGLVFWALRPEPVELKSLPTEVAEASVVEEPVVEAEPAITEQAIDERPPPREPIGVEGLRAEHMRVKFRAPKRGEFPETKVMDGTAQAHAQKSIGAQVEAHRDQVLECIGSPEGVWLLHLQTQDDHDRSEITDVWMNEASPEQNRCLEDIFVGQECAAGEGSFRWPIRGSDFEQ